MYVRTYVRTFVRVGLGIDRLGATSTKCFGIRGGLFEGKNFSPNALYTLHMLKSQSTAQHIAYVQNGLVLLTGVHPLALRSNLSWALLVKNLGLLRY